MEGLTMAAIEHLDNATVIFVMDLTGECGTAVRDQVRRLFSSFFLGSAQAKTDDAPSCLGPTVRREELLEKFPDKARRWVDVFTKADLFDAERDFRTRTATKRNTGRQTPSGSPPRRRRTSGS